MNNDDENGEIIAIKRKRGRPPKPRILSDNQENAPRKVHANSIANLKPGGAKKRNHIRKDVKAHLAELGFDPLTEMVEICRHKDCPTKVRADLTKELLSYCSVKPKHQLQSDNVNALTELFSMVATDGRPLPATAVTYDSDAVLIEHEGEEED